MTKPPILEAAAITHRGLIRMRNEDCVAVDGRMLNEDMTAPWSAELGYGRHSFIVADGMGGHSHGALASRTVVEALVAAPKALFDMEACLGLCWKRMRKYTT
jgi:PPM family protein phosphatase